jgi:hypothetical protein
MTGLMDALAGNPVERRVDPFNDQSVLDFVDRYASVTTREVSEVFGVSMVEAHKALELVVNEGSLAAGGNHLVYRTAVSATCDATSRTCL